MSNQNESSSRDEILARRNRSLNQQNVQEEEKIVDTEPVTQSKTEKVISPAKLFDDVKQIRDMPTFILDIVKDETKGAQSNTKALMAYVAFHSNISLDGLPKEVVEVVKKMRKERNTNYALMEKLDILEEKIQDYELKLDGVNLQIALLVLEHYDFKLAVGVGNDINRIPFESDMISDYTRVLETKQAQRYKKQARQKGRDIHKSRTYGTKN